MPLIMIVESEELSKVHPKLGTTSLLARHYIGKGKQMDIRSTRLEEGTSLDSEFVRDLAHEVDAEATPAVEEGQVWQALDPRTIRMVRITLVNETHAEVENMATKHRTRIRLAAFCGRGNKGYRYIGS
jgi:hypothetical protein